MKESEIPKFGLEKRLAQIDYMFSGSRLESVFKKLRNDDDFGKEQFNILSTMVSFFIGFLDYLNLRNIWIAHYT